MAQRLPVIAVWTTGAPQRTSLSSMMASFSPTFSPVRTPNACPSRGWNVTLTSYCPASFL
jgi:hypothetical protein